VTALSRPQLLAGFVTVVVICAIVAGIFVLGPPSDERARRLDERRVAQLIEIAQAIDGYSIQHKRLPASFDELQAQTVAAIDRDPVTNAPYEYRPSADSYELCAVFQRQSENSATRSWAHRAGHHCFQRRIQKPH
jgi:hypothetical protein